MSEDEERFRSLRVQYGVIDEVEASMLAEEQDRSEWIGDVKVRLGIVCSGDDPDVIYGHVFGDRERAVLSLSIEEEIRRREIPFEFEAIARRLPEGLPEGYTLTFGPVTPIFGEDRD